MSQYPKIDKLADDTWREMVYQDAKTAERAIIAIVSNKLPEALFLPGFQPFLDAMIDEIFNAAWTGYDEYGFSWDVEDRQGQQ